MQYEAAEKIVERVLDKIIGRGKKDHGLVWHWQGSGKTLTMIFAINKLYLHPDLENPSIFIIIDRKDLEEQLTLEYEALDLTKSENIGSVADLKKILTHDQRRGKRGIFITLIHKFQGKIDDAAKWLETVSKTDESIMTRGNVLLFIYEAHRTQYGTLAGNMRNIFKNAFSFGFTGTPISEDDKDTYKLFSYLPDEPYMHRYFISDSIRDGSTVKIVYKPALIKGIHVDKEQLAAFYNLQLDEVPDDLREIVDKRIKEKLNAARLFLESESRMQVTSKDIATHFKENIHGKFKAMVVAVSRKACVTYKRSLDELFQPAWTEVVMTHSMSDAEKHPETEFSKELSARYNDKEADEINKAIVDKFKNEENPQILIVTDMLLTGFDAPRLQTMYLDKLLKEHRLLQAVARTNRPFKDLKEAGLIIDYAGVFSELKKALKIYAEEDVKESLWNLDQVKKEFVNLLQEPMKLFKDIPQDKVDRQTLMKTVEILNSGKESKDFTAQYKKLRRLFQMLDPATILDHVSKYNWLTAVYSHYKKLVLRPDQSEADEYAKKYFDKTVNLIQENTAFQGIANDIPELELNETFIEKLKFAKTLRKKRQALYSHCENLF